MPLSRARWYTGINSATASTAWWIAAGSWAAQTTNDGARTPRLTSSCSTRVRNSWLGCPAASRATYVRLQSRPRSWKYGTQPGGGHHLLDAAAQLVADPVQLPGDLLVLAGVDDGQHGGQCPRLRARRLRQEEDAVRVIDAAAEAHHVLAAGQRRRPGIRWRCPSRRCRGPARSRARTGLRAHATGGR